MPVAKLQNGEKFSIFADHLGTPVMAVDSEGKKIWEAEFDIYGKMRTFAGKDKAFIPFRYQGQYEDEETGLYYNRFRYYSPDSGTYISQDPIRLASGEDNLYAYVWDINSWVDVFGLKVTPGQVGSYGDLVKASEVRDNLDLHHIPQDKLGHLPRKDGIAVVMPHDEHKLTRTYKSKGRKIAAIDKNRAFKDVLADDLADLRKIGGEKYDSSIKKKLVNMSLNKIKKMKCH